jgi:hypothetical protein
MDLSVLDSVVGEVPMPPMPVAHPLTREDVARPDSAPTVRAVAMVESAEPPVAVATRRDERAEEPGPDLATLVLAPVFVGRMIASTLLEPVTPLVEFFLGIRRPPAGTPRR